MPVVVAPNESAIALSRHGLIDYTKAWDVQRKIHSEVVQGARPNTLLLLEHPSVYTAGRRTEQSEKPIDGTPVIDVDRGGKITWHGPGQLVGYPIVKLAKPHELVGFVREIESGLINACEEFGISAMCVSGRTGVWIRDGKGDRKIAAIGIRVAQGVTMHGFALNVCPNLDAFKQIIPCGIADAQVTSMQEELGREISIDEVTPIIERHIFESLRKVSA
ncbi:MAG: lipoyl(octanoyl) transferase LipB [Actinobacteria bacterium]|uniref:lipoyl(octanoyl) transferase n=1 Tax=freshwater metagenome TaxID=449393 RepID=A0A6J7VDF6_9ZZZZ|nr:lipoyl(octanoyl) transferase LipB [Actinomycetota bacterium]MSY36015.1 lipoyl(octanoyl) transferase LipB [Actinomycetota bacterium]MTA72682.1 lipoyl(octanoyl) transferase LipB [Actinomycetota bacterium]MTB29488.1 lipoyl(octanoyl) transferase LipB [Actinomycetota bacterium]MUH48963.1 lipoyl(octanoyl) transferase LipB [Actinomycetota bacterium]